MPLLTQSQRRTTPQQHPTQNSEKDHKLAARPTGNTDPRVGTTPDAPRNPLL
jgi:hypothetical protein